jgi:hypothetical protein
MSSKIALIRVLACGLLTGMLGSAALWPMAEAAPAPKGKATATAPTKGKGKAAPAAKAAAAAPAAKGAKK